MSQIYVVDIQGASEPMKKIRCKNEDLELQRLLEQNYDLLPGEQIDPDDPRRWMLVKREMSVPNPATGADRWSIDFFFVDQDAMPTFVECKRFDDTRARREIVGQLLEYAANGHHYWTANQLRELARTTAVELGKNMESELDQLHPTDDLGMEDFFNQVQLNLREGRLRIIFFLDESPFELRSVVEFLNNQMERSEVLIVEARQYLTSNEFRIVAPTVFGYTEQARLVKKAEEHRSFSGRRRWDNDAFFEAAEETLGLSNVAPIRTVYDGALDLDCEVTWGTGVRNGSFNVRESNLSQRSFLSVYSNGRIDLHFKWLNDNERIERLRDRFIQLSIEKLDLPSADYREKAHHSVDFRDWRDRADDVIGILRGLLDEFREA